MRLALAIILTLLGLVPASAQFNGTNGIFALNHMTFGIMPGPTPSGGSGYAIGDTVTLDCPNSVYFSTQVYPIVTITSVAGGVPTSILLTNPGYATQLPSTGLAGGNNGTCALAQIASSGTGTGLTVLSTFGFNAASSAPILQPTPGSLNVALWPGVDPTGSTDSTTGLQAAAATGLNLFFPPGSYQFASLSLTSNQTLTCASIGFTGTGATILEQNSTSGNFITMSGFWNLINNCQFTPIVRTTGFQVVAANACFSCELRNFWFTHTFNGILDQAGNEFKITNGIIGSILGTTGIDFVGTSGHNANNLIVNNVIINNAYPLPYGTVVTWATSTSYTANEITKVNSAIYQESAASCTSASSGTGPSGFPAGTDPYSPFTGTIADGTCTWRFVSNDLIGLLQENYADSADVTSFATLNNLESVKIFDIANTNASHPSFDHFTRLTGDHNFWSTFDGQGGFNIELDDTYAGSSLALNGIQTGGNFVGDLKVIGGRVADNWEDGIFLSVGSQFTVTGVAVGSNSQAGSGVHNNIEVAAGIQQFTVTNNMVGKDLEAGNANANWGVIVQTGTSDYYTVTGNICHGDVVTACVSDGGSGTHKSIPTTGNGANW